MSSSTGALTTVATTAVVASTSASQMSAIVDSVTTTTASVVASSSSSQASAAVASVATAISQAVAAPMQAVSQLTREREIAKMLGRLKPITSASSSSSSSSSTSKIDVAKSPAVASKDDKKGAKAFDWNNLYSQLHPETATKFRTEVEFAKQVLTMAIFGAKIPTLLAAIEKSTQEQSQILIHAILLRQPFSQKLMASQTSPFYQGAINTGQVFWNMLRVDVALSKSVLEERLVKSMPLAGKDYHSVDIALTLLAIDAAKS